jgi:flavin reductase (DIM6/NTAB) family NADH-FMN oxidoreductase RutF
MKDHLHLPEFTPPMAVAAQDYLAAMAKLATSVSIVTTDGIYGRRGLTVSAVNSVTIDDEGPVLLVCVNDRSGAGAAIAGNGAFCVNTLAEGQADLAKRFARPEVRDRFAGLPFTASVHGAPRFREAYVAFDCAVMQEASIGTHRIFYGRVAAVTHGTGEGPLVYAHHNFCTAVPHATAA